MSSHLYLIGFMGAGKSSVARLVAERLGRPFYDLDALIERTAATTIPVIFAEQGEEAFRRMESEHLQATADLEPAVIACGGGVVVIAQNRALLCRLGVVVYLKVTVGEALARVGDGATRPLLAGPGGELAATALLQAREGLYTSTGDATVDTVEKTPESVADEVVRVFRELESE